MPDIDFFDDEHVEESWNLSRTLHALQPHANNPVLRPTEPWESLLCAYGSVLRDDQQYRAYYTLWWLDPRAPFGCNAEAMAYAFSHDGIHWTKPDLGLIEQVNGGRNNLIHYGRYADQPCVLRLAEVRDDKQYVMLYYGDFPPLGSGVRVCYSSDGIRWEWPGEMLWQTHVDRFASEIDFFAADDTLTCYFDAIARKYVILRKVMQEDGLCPASERKGNWSPDRFRARRVIARAESSDLKTLDDVRIVLAPDRDDPPGVDFHRLCVVPFRQRYLGLLEIHNGIEGVNSVDVELVYSRCGKNWVRVGRWQGPFIPRGSAGTWNEGVVFTPSGGICFDTRTYLKSRIPRRRAARQ